MARIVGIICLGLAALLFLTFWIGVDTHHVETAGSSFIGAVFFSILGWGLVDKANGQGS